MTIIEERLTPDITLKHGMHDPASGEMCLLESVAYIAGEEWGDHPECVCPVLGAFGRAWNDGLPDDETRTRLLAPFIPRLVGTRSTSGVETTRAFMACDWAVRAYSPVWLRAAGLNVDAEAMENLPALTSTQLCRDAMPIIAAARDAARAAAGAAAWDAARDAARAAARAAARDAAWAAAGAAAWDAAGAAAGDAARDAAGDAAGDAARDAAGDAARDAARDAAWAAAGAAAWDAAGDAAWAAAGAAAWDAAGDAARAAAGDAARAAAWDALAPHVVLLQTSAVDLFDRMIQVGE